MWTCREHHPTCLHEERSEESKETKPERARPQAQAISHNVKQLPVTSRIVPVWLLHVEQPGTECLVYILLDTQSDTTFVIDEVAEMWDEGAKPVKLDCKRLEGLQA